ncbi:NPCBM/NEW2 domain-containing protein [Nocardia sp. NRRL S-836]|uniref:NPCBM/NEW2 domain-containing protein n=1 Tax=Nocardia sp. NRRL S-836 TaxID=1519492 RepID=UPI0006ADDDD9|nr:NPCBM/NEW2 domain-containing protein [Nocardia sp. NRRL S-836]KOV84171.1 hypothetical protein ADL03_18305 [Nocardia sp. NRRL S-836]
MRTLALAVLTTVAGAVLTTPAASALPDGLALTPPMGFNNWNTTACRAEFNEAMVKGIADIFVDKCSSLTVDVGVDDEVAPGRGSVVFQVFADDA